MGSIAIATLFSLFVGFPGLFFTEKIVGAGGLNNRVHNWVYHLGKVRKLEQTDPTESLRFIMWAKSAGMYSSLSFLTLKYSIVNGIIIGSEIAIIGNVFTVPLILIFIGISLSRIVFFSAIFVLSIIIFLITWQFDKVYFKKNQEGHIKAINQFYEKWQRQQSGMNINKKKIIPANI